MKTTNKQIVVRSSSISFLSLLGLAFIILKLTGHIDWSWWWVTCPLWLPLALVLSVFLIFLIVFALKK